MKTHISIPTPCHEDWNKMTANEKGAFCGKCCKTVIDFSGMPAEEISHTLALQSGKKICGRFKDEQISAPTPKTVHLSIPSFKVSGMSGSGIFAIALFIVFGTSLFSCVTPAGHTVGEIAIVDTSHTSATTDPSVFSGNDTTMGAVAPEFHTMGDVEFIQGEIALPDSVIQPEN